MIKALVKNGEKMAVMDFPVSYTELGFELSSIGIYKRPLETPIRDEENEPTSVKVFGDDPFSARVAALFTEDHTLGMVNTVASVIDGLNQGQADELNYELAHGGYDTPKELLDGIQNMLNTKDCDMGGIEEM